MIVIILIPLNFFSFVKMLKLIRDVLYLIFKELQDDKKTLHSCLLVNKTWCEIIVPILWKNSWIYSRGKEKLLLSVIIQHLSNEFKNYIMSRGINILKNYYKKPLFDYINFCKYLNIYEIEGMINTVINEKSDVSIIQNVINLFYQRE